MGEQNNYRSNAISAAISGGSGFLGSIVSGLFNTFTNRKNRKVQQEENQKDRDFNADQAQLARNWEEQMYQNYQSPVAQAQQRQQAGLNPAEGVSSMSVGSGSSASHNGSISPSSYQDPIGPMISQLPSIMESFKQMRLQTKQMETNLESSTLDLQKKALEAGNYEEAVKLQMELMRDEAKRAKWTAEEARANAERALADTEMFKTFQNSGGNIYQTADDVAREGISASEANRKFQDAQTEYQKLMGEIAQAKLPYEKEVLKANAQSLRANAAKAYADSLVSNAQADLIKTNKLKVDQEITNLKGDEARAVALHVVELAIEEENKKQAVNKTYISNLEKRRYELMHGYNINNLSDWLTGFSYMIEDTLFRTNDVYNL